MTPEERARAVVQAWYKGPYNVHDWDEEARSIEIADIAAAIRAAVEECAKMADEHYEDGEGEGLGNAIRARFGV